MRTLEDVVEELKSSESHGLSSYNTLTPVYDFINYEHFNYDNQVRIARQQMSDSGRIIELGCGTGQLLKRLEEEYNVEAIGVDINRPMLQRANERTSKSVLLQADVRDLVFRSSVNESGVLMLGRVFSKMLTDECVDRLARSLSTWMSKGSTIVFNTFRRSDLVDGMEKKQEWSRGGKEVRRHSETKLREDVRDGLMEIRMDYTISVEGLRTVEASEVFKLRGYDLSDVRPTFEKHGFELSRLEPNRERSTHFMYFTLTEN